MSAHVLLIGTDPDYVTLVRHRLDPVQSGAVELRHVKTGAVGLRAVSDATLLALVDVSLSDDSGLVTVDRLRAQHPDLPVLLLTSADQRSVSSEAFGRGATDVLIRGRSDLARIEEWLRQARDGDDDAAVPTPDDDTTLVGESAAMTRVFRMIEKAQQGRLSVAILGESGTGKELVARTLHEQSDRAAGPFVAVNCAAIPPDLAESTFFGHEKGAFTGATEQQPGHFEQADGGTLFLDEIGELDLDLQSKLLRVLETEEVQRVGSSTPIPVDARILCATNADPQAMIEAGTFREDLYYRLFQFPIRLPPLRERGHDVILLARQFLSREARTAPDAPRSFSREARRQMLQYDWPGNVRELKTQVQRAVLLADGPEITPAALFPETEPLPSTHTGDGSPQPLDDAPGPASTFDVPEAPSPADDEPSSAPSPDPAPSSPETASPTEAAPRPSEVTSVEDIVPLDQLKVTAARRAVEVCDGNVARAAEALEVARSTVYRLLDEG
ncbi:MAG: sigma-54-dependent transcriptional regulator [Salinibacter sp.]